jgi:hypothetical protein
VRMRKAKAFSEEIDETLNSTLIRWIVELNYPGCAVPRLRRNFDDLEQREDPVKVVQMLTQLVAIGYEVRDLDWIRDKLEIPSLAKVDQAAQAAMMGGAPASMTEPKTQEQMDDVSNGAMGAFGSDNSDVLKLFDFEEFDEESSKLERTKRDEIAESISAGFSGSLDDVGYERIISDTGRFEASMAKVNIDEYTSPAEIAFGARRLLDEIDRVGVIGSYEYSVKDELKRTLGPYESSLQSTADFNTDNVDAIIELYKKAYRLNRRVVHNECVVVDCNKAGYMKYFAPYFM